MTCLKCGGRLAYHWVGTNANTPRLPDCLLECLFCGEQYTEKQLGIRKETLMVRPPNPFGRGIAHPGLYDAFEEGVTAGMKAVMEWVEHHSKLSPWRDNRYIPEKDWQVYCQELRDKLEA